MLYLRTQTDPQLAAKIAVSQVFGATCPKNFDDAKGRLKGIITAQKNGYDRLVGCSQRIRARTKGLANEFPTIEHMFEVANAGLLQIKGIVQQEIAALSTPDPHLIVNNLQAHLHREVTIFNQIFQTASSLPSEVQRIVQQTEQTHVRERLLDNVLPSKHDWRTNLHGLLIALIPYCMFILSMAINLSDFTVSTLTSPLFAVTTLVLGILGWFGLGGVLASTDSLASDVEFDNDEVEVVSDVGDDLDTVAGVMAGTAL